MEKWRYGVILDAGSSGTRVHIYSWMDPEEAKGLGSAKELQSLPVLTTDDKWTKKIHPGVSSFGQNLRRIGPDHLEPLLHRALEIVPNEEVKDTPIFLLATAGMRLLPAAQQEAVLKEICSYTRAKTKFLLPDCSLHIQVIPGKTEGLYGWIAVNYLLGGFDSPQDHNHGKGHHTYGFLDMGGASAQIAFAPNATEAQKHADNLTLLRMRKLNGMSNEYRVFVTTWLEYGVNEARRRYVERLVKEKGLDVEDPCLPKGLKMTAKGELISRAAVNAKVVLTGTGEFEKCLELTYPLLDKEAPCPDEPCLLHGAHAPAIDFDVNHFVGISEYWHTTHEIFEISHKDKTYDFGTYQTRVKEFCQQDWTTIIKAVEAHKWGKKVDKQTAYEVCFKASWLINFLHDGIGIPRVGLEETVSMNGTKKTSHEGKKGFLDPFRAVNKIRDTEISWTLGKMVLYAASRVPPLDSSALPVGFGANEAGIPQDFQYPSSEKQPHPDDFEEEWHDTLFAGDSPRRIPGVLLFLLILIIVAFLLCGRDRRSKLYRKLGATLGTSPSGKRRSGRPSLSSKLSSFFSRSSSSSITYERVLEDGPEDDLVATSFELGDVIDPDDPDSPSPTRTAKSSGWATPSLSFNPAPESSNRPGSRNGGVQAPAMDRAGLVVRTESRERLDLNVSAVGGGGGRSRGGSPVRGLGRR